MAPSQTDSSTSCPSLLRISVIIPIYNGETDLPDLINCLRAQTYPAEWVEYLLVDNASYDHTADILQAAVQNAKSWGLTIHHLTEDQIQSSYAARNAGIGAATGEILAFTDVDCRPQPDWLHALVQPFTDPAVGLVAGSVEALPGKTLPEKYAAQQNYLSAEEGLADPFCPYVVTANLAVRHQALEQVGLFRSHLTTGGDVDLSWRILRQTSWQLYYAKQAIVKHRYQATVQGLLSQLKRYGRSHRYLHELYGIDLRHELVLQEYLYPSVRWLLKLPIDCIKVIIGKATLVDLFSRPIYLLTTYAYLAGQREARLPEQARQIEWLSSQTVSPDSTVSQVVLPKSKDMKAPPR